MTIGKRSAVSTAVTGVLIIIVIVVAGGGFYFYGTSQSKVTTTTATVTSTTLSTTSLTSTATLTSTSTSATTVTSTVTPTNTIAPLRIFAAASFTPALQALQSSYQNNNSVSLIYNFASSGTLETQIAQGSPADVFLDADISNNVKLQNLSMLSNGNSYSMLIYNYIALFVPANNPKNITQLSDLLKPGVRIAIGAPASVPAGKYTQQVWANVAALWGNSSSGDFQGSAYTNYATAVSSHVVTQATDVESAITQVLTGAADAAFGYVSDGVANAAQLKMISIPPDVNVQAQYTVSMIKGTKYSTQAAAFIKYLTSAQGQAFLKTWGFTPLSSAIPSFSLTVTGATGNKVVLNASSFASLIATGGTGSRKSATTGAISGSGTYVGVPITAILSLVGGISPGQSVNITGSDGFAAHYTYQQIMNGTGYNTYNPTTGNSVTPTFPLALLLAFSFNGASLGTSASGGSGPLRTALIGEQGLATDGGLWVKWVVSIQVLNTP